MKKIVPATAAMLMSAMGYAASPSEHVLMSCLEAEAVAPSVTIKNLNTEEVTRQEKYAEGFDALYMFEYRGSDVGYAQGEGGDAVIYLGRLGRLSKAISVGDNRGIKLGSFNPFLAEWRIVKGQNREYLCVSFSFDGLGRSGDYQNVRGGYLLDTATKYLYFAVRDIRN